MTLQGFYALSLGLGLIAYVGLTIFCTLTWARKITGRAAFAASLLSLLFIVSLALTGIGPVSFSLEAMALLAWIALLFRIVGVTWQNLSARPLRPVIAVFALATVLASVLLMYAWALPLGLQTGIQMPVAGLFVVEVLLAICGLILLEQVVRNTRDDLRWRLRHLNIGLGTLFCFQLVHSASALLFNAYVPIFVALQPAVFALAAPFIALASLRNSANPLRLNLSRRFVFSSGVLMVAGAFLLLMGLLGYLVRALDQDWGAALVALLTIVAGMATTTIFGSSHVRMRGRRWIEEHLFPTKYDYREEWRRVTEQLTEPNPDYDLPQQILRALSGVLKSNGGAVWRLSPQGVLTPLNQLHTSWTMPLSATISQQLRSFFEDREWVLDLRKLPPEAKPVIDQCRELTELEHVRFLVPMIADSRLFGIAALTEPPLSLDLSWEDYSLLKLVARQSAGFLALREADRELAEAEKLSGLNQMTAFVVHDVKTISSQLSLLLENASKHRENPAFISDMLATVDNSVQRMQKLLGQLRGDSTIDPSTVDLSVLLREMVDSAKQLPKPELHLPDDEVSITADTSRLRSAIAHLIQNAADAASIGQPLGSCESTVTVELRKSASWAEVDIADNGPGMEQNFIADTLFEPFASTKGVSGMGIGAYQARSYVRSLGGDISVVSAPGKGSCFTIRLPLDSAHG